MLMDDNYMASPAAAGRKHGEVTMPKTTIAKPLTKTQVSHYKQAMENKAQELRESIDRKSVV